MADSNKGVKFRSPAGRAGQQPPPAASAPLTEQPHLRLGLLSQGGSYTTEALELGPSGGAGVLITDVSASNLSARAVQEPGGRWLLELTFVAERPGPCEESLTVVLPGTGEVHVRISATVMPRDKGTPQLRPNVRCTGFAPETDIDL